MNESDNIDLDSLSIQIYLGTDKSLIINEYPFLCLCLYLLKMDAYWDIQLTNFDSYGSY